jgi:hypothetical protein
LYFTSMGQNSIWMTITELGNVGIGISIPEYKLDVIIKLYTNVYDICNAIISIYIE